MKEGGRGTCGDKHQAEGNVGKGWKERGGGGGEGQQKGHNTHTIQTETQLGAGIAQLVVLGLAVHRSRV